jgi:hypothetical protein
VIAKIALNLFFRQFFIQQGFHGTSIKQLRILNYKL